MYILQYNIICDTKYILIICLDKFSEKLKRMSPVISWTISHFLHSSPRLSVLRQNLPQTILFSCLLANTTSASLRKRRAMCNPRDLTRAKIPISCSPDPRANKGYLPQWDCVSVHVHGVRHNATHTQVSSFTRVLEC